MKAIHFTHTDLDGVGCAILSSIFYEDISIIYCENNTINDEVNRFLDSHYVNDFDLILITDISVNINTATRLAELGSRVKLIDHHSTGLWLNTYSFAEVKVSYTDDKKASGTSLLYDYLKHNFNSILKFVQHLEGKLDNFVEFVRAYDTWEWQQRDDRIPVKLNCLLQLYGRQEFYTRMHERLTVRSWSEEFINEEEVHYIAAMQLMTDNYIASFDKIIERDICGYHAGIVFADRDLSLLGNALAEKYKFKYDFIAMINPQLNIVSFRSLEFNDIKLGTEIAKVFGGGGHNQAAGCEFTMELTDAFIDSIFKVAE